MQKPPTPTPPKLSSTLELFFLTYFLHMYRTFLNRWRDSERGQGVQRELRHAALNSFKWVTLFLSLSTRRASAKATELGRPSALGVNQGRESQTVAWFTLQSQTPTITDV